MSGSLTIVFVRKKRMKYEENSKHEGLSSNLQISLNYKLLYPGCVWVKKGQKRA
jgi:hypothetical protein